MSLSYEQRYELLKLKENMRTDMNLFGRLCFPTAMTKKTPPFHHQIYKKLIDRRKKRILVAAPRGTAKSTLDSLIYPMHRIAFKEPDEDIYIVIISESQSQSKNFLDRIKYHLETSEYFKMLFGTLGQSTAKRWREEDVILGNGARIIAVGTGQRLRGFISNDTRPTDIIVDDFESELNAVTREARTKNRLWMTNAVIPSLSSEGRILFVGTPISEDCFLYWAKNGDTWDVMWYQICEDLERCKTHPDDLTNLLWPDEFPAERILAIHKEAEEIGNLNGFWQERMCVAQSPDDAPFQPHYIRYHDYKLETIDGHFVLVKKVGEHEELIPVNIYLGCDPASSLAVTADYFVVAVLGVDADKNWYIIDIIRGRFDPAKQPDILVDTYIRYPGKRMRIETVQYQEALRSGTRQLMHERGVHIPGLERGARSRTPKSERLLDLVPDLARGKFYFRDGDINAVNEFLSYPRGKHDDILDAIWFAKHGAKAPTVKEITRDGDRNKVRRKKRERSLSWKVR